MCENLNLLEKISHLSIKIKKWSNKYDYKSAV